MWRSRIGLLYVGWFFWSTLSTWGQQRSPIDIYQLREQIEKLEAIDRDPAVSVTVREVNYRYLDQRRADLRMLLQQEVLALRTYQSNLNFLTAEEKKEVADQIQKLENELQKVEAVVLAPAGKLLSDLKPNVPSAASRGGTPVIAAPPWAGADPRGFVMGTKSQNLAITGELISSNAQTSSLPASKSNESRSATTAKGGTLRGQDGSNEIVRFFPGSYIRIYEDTDTERILIYDPKQSKYRSTQLTADADSKLIIEIDEASITEFIALNKLFMAAELTRSNNKTSHEKVEVIGYSEVGQSQATAAAQNAVAFQTANALEAALVNMYYTTKDLIMAAYGPNCAAQLAANPRADCGRTLRPNQTEQDIGRLFQFYQPEIEAIADLFQEEKNRTIADLLGQKIFGVDPASLHKIAQQYKANLQLLVNSKPGEEANNNARYQLLERTKLVWYDFGFINKELASLESQIKESDPAVKRKKAREQYLQSVRDEIMGQLKPLLVPGTILLSQKDAKDGDFLTLRIEAKGPGGEGIGIPAMFRIALKSYGPKVRISPSLIFVRRQGIKGADLNLNNPNAVNRISFSPFPGVTLSATFFHRGLERFDLESNTDKTFYRPVVTSWDRFLGALAPGIGLNFTFLNFNDPRDFDPTKGSFTKTNGTNFQAGAGVVGSLFNNKLQVLYGWNLNAERKRRYVGLGFGFIEVGKSLAGFVTK